MNVSELISSLIETLEGDRASPHPRYPDQAAPALRDARVVKALESRFGRNQTLTGITPQGYNFFTGLISICFEFTPHGAIGLAADGVLVVMNKDCRVIAVVESFNPVQPNTFFPPLRRWGDEPFVIAQLSACETIVHHDRDLQPREERCRQLFEEIGLPPGVHQMPIGGRGPVGDGDQTVCQYATSGMCGIRRICMERTGVFGRCDYTDTEYVPDYRLDSPIDDSGFSGSDDD